ncbi:MAG: PadR family transcriptional regulator [Gemmatimonadota bacterium]
MAGNLGELEQLVLLALLRLGDEGYGVTVRHELETAARRQIDLGTVYKTLLRLEEKGLISARIGPPTAERGGRRKKLYWVLPAGHRALDRSLEALRRMASGLSTALEGR